MIGTRLGHYEVTEKLGSGGMGEVYAARDTRLEREVALKLLPKELAGDGQRLARFEREARAIAALNHPNIVTLYSIEHEDGANFITLERVHGKTISDLIPRRGCSPRQFFEYAVPLADALAMAHRHGIMHRDLKPDNLMVNTEGHLKVLDFGLAKLLEEDVTDPGVSTVTHLTQEGFVMGTVAYMSPEQAEGRAVDHRSDIFSAGVVLYEMATAERPFKGDTRASLMTSILRDTPAPVTDLNRTMPYHVGRIIRKCLAKNPDQRYQSAQDLKIDLVELAREVESGTLTEMSGEQARAIVRRRLRAPWLAGVVLALAAGAVGSGATWWLAGRGQPAAETSLATAGTFSRVSEQVGLELEPSISPDGKMVVYTSFTSAGRSDLLVQRAGGRNAINLTRDTPGKHRHPAFSPDGERIAFSSDREGGGIFVMGALGESLVRVTDFGSRPAWSPDGGRIVFETDNWADPTGRNPPSELWIVDVKTREKHKLYEGDAVQPAWSPNGQRIAFWALPKAGGQRDLWTISAMGGTPRAVTRDAALDFNPAWSPDGKYLYFSSNRGGSINVWRVAIDQDSGEVLGEPQPVTRAVGADNHSVALSRDGKRMVYVSGVNQNLTSRASFDPGKGALAGPLAPLPGEARTVVPADESRDGQWLVFQRASPVEDLFVLKTDGTGLRQLTNDSAKDRGPQWSPDGKNITFYSDRSGEYEIWMVGRDGSGLRKLVSSPGDTLTGAIWSPDGKRIVYSRVHDGDLGTLMQEMERPDAAPTALPRLPDPDLVWYPTSWSPDGRWLAGQAARRGQMDFAVALYAYDLEQGAWKQLQAVEGQFPQWLPDSRHLLYSVSNTLFMLDTATGRTREILSVDPGANFLPFLVARDGKTVYVTEAHAESDIWMLAIE